VVHSPPGPPEEGDHDDLAALAFGAAGSDPGETDLGEILGDYGTGALPEDGGDDATGDALFPPGADIHAETEMPLFTVTNPPGTVTVTTYMDGRVHRVDLSSAATRMAESALSEEIVLIAGLATQDARSAQYTFLLDGMREQGNDNAATRDFLKRDLDLPTPEQARAARAELFTTRYTEDHD